MRTEFSANVRRAFLALILLTCLVTFGGCTRSISSPAKLTQAAVRYELTQIQRRIDYPTLAALDTRAAQAAFNPESSETPAPIGLIPFGNEPEITATETPIPVIAFDPPTLVPRATATARPVIESDLSITSDPDHIQLTPFYDDPFLVPNAEYYFQPLETIEPTETALPDLQVASERKIYLTQNGDTLQNIASRFGTSPDRISALFPISGTRFLNPNLTLFVESPINRQYESSVRVLPDQYVVFSSTASNYDIENEILAAGGYLARYSEETSVGRISGIKIVEKIAQDYSVNPMILLALIEFKSHWLFGEPQGQEEIDYPVGWIEAQHKGLYRQLAWAANTLSAGYYGWRAGRLSEIPYYRKPLPIQPIYFEPTLNAGSVAIQYLFAQIYDWNDVDAALYSENGFISVFTSIFGNVWDGADPEGIGLNADLPLPVISLPFSPQERWALTGGPHPIWGTGSPWGALDFAPPSTETGCVKSDRWILAATDGVVLRVDRGIVIVDVDGDYNEQTGWVFLYLHVGSSEKVAVGTRLHTGDHVGHPSCEGGNATGSHLHLARKYNGEWIAADGPIPFNLSGWIPYNGALPYQGGMFRNGQLAIANPYGPGESLVYH